MTLPRIETDRKYEPAYYHTTAGHAAFSRPSRRTTSPDSVLYPTSSNRTTMRSSSYRRTVPSPQVACRTVLCTGNGPLTGAASTSPAAHRSQCPHGWSRCSPKQASSACPRQPAVSATLRIISIREPCNRWWRWASAKASRAARDGCGAYRGDAHCPLWTVSAPPTRSSNASSCGSLRVPRPVRFASAVRLAGPSRRVAASAVSSATSGAPPVKDRCSATSSARHSRSTWAGWPSRAGRRVHDALPGQPGQTGGQPLPAQLLGRAVHRGEEQVGPVEVADDHPRVAQPQPLDDVLPYRRRGGRGQRHHRRPAQLRDQVAELQVVGTEVVPPRGDAVCLVDGDQRRPQRPYLGQPLRLRQLFRRDEQEPRGTVAHRLQRRPLLVRRLRRADPHRALTPPGEPHPLVVLQRQQRRDHHGRTVQQGRRHLVDRRLAGAGRQDDQGVATAQDGPHGGQLSRPQRAPPEIPAGGAAQLHRG